MKKLNLTLLFIFFLLSQSIIGLAQKTYSVTGKITDEKGEGLPGAIVFLTNTKRNTTTNTTGAFTFTSLEPGTYELVVKMIGYLPFISKFTINEKIVVINAVLKEDNVMLKTVTIKATDPNAAEHLKLFTKYFIGESTNSNQCKITNPQVLNFRYEKENEVLEVSADKFLIIENEGLGYRINYLLNDFKLDTKNLIFSYTGHPYFEELKGSASQETRWNRNRIEAYNGSYNHFFKSVVNQTTEHDGFLIYPLSDKAVRMKLPAMAPVSAGTIFTATKNGSVMLRADYNQRTTDDTTAIFVFYKGGYEPRNFINSGIYLQPPVKLPAHGQLSKIEPLTNTISINKNGVISPEQSFLVSGYWSWTKVAEMLPLDFGSASSPIQPIIASPAASSKIADRVTVDDIVSRFKFHAAYNFTEKIYLQLNKSWFKRADTLWFKAYVVTADHKLTDVSNVAYAELINNKDSVLQRLKLHLHNGMADGDFTIPITTEPGTYRVRAYTNWMRNNDERNFYYQNINIGGIPPATSTADMSTGNSAAQISTKPNLPIDVQFFPEGGVMVSDVSCRVAFKALNTDGSAADITGTIVTDGEEKVAELKTEHNGMGSFTFVPAHGKSYHAVITHDRQKQTVALPMAENKGISLAVGSSSIGAIEATVAANSTYISNTPGISYSLIGTIGEKIVYRANVDLNALNTKIAIDKKNFPSGILRLTLFSDAGEPLCERVVFIKNNDEMTITGRLDKSVYAVNQKVSLVINTQTGDGKPSLGNLSASVISETEAPVDESNEQSIFSQLLLSSELHGNIANPAYYFKNPDPKKAADLDLLMLTQGFRKLEWKRLIDTTSRPTFIAESGLTISGIVTDMSGKAVAKSKVSLFVPKQHIVADTVTDVNGHFSFIGLDINENSPIMVKALKGNNSDLNISIDHDYPAIKAKTLSGYSKEIPTEVLSSMQKNYAKQEQDYPLTGPRANARELKEVTIKARKDAKPDLSYSSNLHGGGQANQVIMGKELSECTRLSDCLRGLLHGITVYPGGKIVYLGRGRTQFNYIPGDATATIVNGQVVQPKQQSNDHTMSEDDDKVPTQPMAVFLDGTQINARMINYINANDIAFIEVLTSAAYTSIYGHDGAGGVILITSKRGNFMNEKLNEKKAPGIVSYMFNGYYKERTFYTPKYKPAILPDYEKPEIYWKPDIFTDTAGNANLEFTNKGKGQYRVTIEGIDADGHLGRKVLTYKVQ